MAQPLCPVLEAGARESDGRSLPVRLEPRAFSAASIKIQPKRSTSEDSKTASRDPGAVRAPHPDIWRHGLWGLVAQSRSRPRYMRQHAPLTALGRSHALVLACTGAASGNVTENLLSHSEADA